MKAYIQVQISVDDFVSGLNEELDWIDMDWDEHLKQYTTKLTNSAGIIFSLQENDR